MNINLNVTLADDLLNYVNERAGGDSMYKNPSEYISDLIRHDMLERDIHVRIGNGLDDIKQNRFSSKSIIDIKNEVLNSNGR